MDLEQAKQVFTKPFFDLLMSLETQENQGLFFYQELIKLGQVERIKNLYRCADKQTKKKTWFRPNPEQEKYLLHQTKRDMILKPRQIGFTELSIVIGRDNCIFTPGATEGMMAHTKDKAVKNLFQRVRDGFQWFIEDWGSLIPLEFGKDEGSKVIILSACGVPIKTSYEVSAEFRSGSLTRLHRSEAAFTAKSKLQASADAVPASCQIIDESTPNGMGGTFYANWQETKKSKEKGDVYVWEDHFFPWFEHYPEAGHTLVVPKNLILDETEQYLKNLGASDLSLTWRRWKIKENFIDDPEKFDQEYPSDDVSCFLGGTSVIPRKYQLMMKRWIKNPSKVGMIVVDNKWLKLIEDQRGYLSIWEMPQVKEAYVIGADPSQGEGGDWAVAYVRKRSTGEYVARIRGQLYPEEFAETLINIGRFYNQAYINFEANNHGWVVKDRLVQKNYPSIYHRRELETETGKWKNELGFITTRDTKERIVNNFVARLREGKVHPMDADLLREATVFQRDNNHRLSSVEGEHDDCIMAACLTEEMDVALGPYEVREDFYDEDIKCDPFTGMPL